MAEYKINPLDWIKQTGYGVQNIFQYMQSGKINYDSVDRSFYKALYNGMKFEDTEFKLSASGMPMGDRWAKFNYTNEQGENDSYLIEMPIYQISRERNINKTMIYGLDTTIKEFQGDGDWQFIMSFYIVGDWPLHTPYGYLDDFIDILSIKKSIEIVSPLLKKTFSVTRVVIDKIPSIIYLDNAKNVMRINVNMLQDELYDPFEKLR